MSKVISAILVGLICFRLPFSSVLFHYIYPTSNVHKTVNCFLWWDLTLESFDLIIIIHFDAFAGYALLLLQHSWNDAIVQWNNTQAKTIHIMSCSLRLFMRFSIDLAFCCLLLIHFIKQWMSCAIWKMHQHINVECCYRILVYAMVCVCTVYL